MPYTTHGYCTPADMAEIRADYDLDELEGRGEPMKCPDCDTRFDGFDGKPSNTCRSCGEEYCNRCIDSHENSCDKLEWDIAEMIAETFGRSVIDADRELAADIIRRIRS